MEEEVVIDARYLERHAIESVVHWVSCHLIEGLQPFQL